ncbi:glutaminyl-peptide cyclotransferase [Marinifilum sp. RC60d5]|uniref:glutaminyl-peptide cyclotransferase n=1 Tax=Marinifilum sp. RC60d5 TaxID=3458414 RepID=UPI0040368F2B
MKFQILILLFSFFLAYGCNGKGSGSDKPANNVSEKPAAKVIEYISSMRLKSPHRGDMFTYGDEINVLMHAKKRAGDIDSVQLIGDGKLVSTLSKKPWVWKWIPEKENMGRHNLKLMAYHESGEIGLLTTHVNLKSNKAPDEYSFEIIKSYPHDKRAYTQGLFYRKGFLYEGTGRNGESTLRKVKLENGEAISVKGLEQQYFGEGICYSNGKIIQLTWNSGKVFVVNPETFEQVDSFEPNTSNNQGWGITANNNELIISDGTNLLTVLDAENYSKKRIIEVYDNAGMLTNLNELEYINGKIYANVWLTDRIVIINPETGKVEGNINLESILKHSEKSKLNHDEVLNGIAWDSENERLFVTGKHWSKLFEIKIEKK